MELYCYLAVETFVIDNFNDSYSYKLKARNIMEDLNLKGENIFYRGNGDSMTESSQENSEKR